MLSFNFILNKDKFFFRFTFFRNTSNYVKKESVKLVPGACYSGIRDS